VEGDLARQAERLAAGRQDLDLQAAAQQHVCEAGARVEQMLAVVTPQHEAYSIF